MLFYIAISKPFSGIRTSGAARLMPSIRAKPLPAPEKSQFMVFKL